MELLFTLLMVFSKMAVANQLSVSPTYFEFQNPAGHTVTENVVIYNSGNEVLKAKISVGDFWYDKEGKRSFPNPGTTPYSSASWISLPNKEIAVPAKGQIAVPFVLSIPPQVPASGYSTLFVERLPAGDNKGQHSSVNISLRIAIPILYRRPESVNARLSLTGFTLTRPTLYKPLLLKFVLNNEDESHVFPEGSITIVKANNKEFVAKEEIHKERVILPKQKLGYELSLPVEPKSGKYEGLMTVFYGKEKTVVKNFSFTIP